MRYSIYCGFVIALMHFTHPVTAICNEDVISVQQYSDESLRHLPTDITTLTLRGSRGYGMDIVTDKGIAELLRYKDLRVLQAGALGLSDESLRTIGQLTKLEELALDSNEITGSGLHHLLNLKQLKKLVLHFNPLSEDWPRTISQLSSLEELCIVVYDQPLTDGMLQELAKLTNLRRLDLNDRANEVTDAGVASLASIKNLTSVNLSDAQATSLGLTQLASLKNLQHLRLRNIRNVDAGSFNWLAKLHNLREFEIVGTRFESVDMRSISELANLESLLIWNVSWGDSVLRIEHLGRHPKLRSFRTNEMLTQSAIRDLSRCSSLEYIGDDLNQITDTDVVELARLPNLRSIHLNSEGITSKSLSALATMKSLRFLSVSDKVKISSDELAQLGKDSLIDCKITARYGNVIYYEPSIRN